MEKTLYKVSAIVKGSVESFVREVRRSLGIKLSDADPIYLTILPARYLRGDLGSAIEFIDNLCSSVDAFEATLSELETFIPATPTIFVRVGHGAQSLRNFHDQLNSDMLASKEEWPYMPHITVVKAASENEAQKLYLITKREWDKFKARRSIQIEELVLSVKSHDKWIDLAHFPLRLRADFTITFDPRVTPEQVKMTLEILADYYRACGGLGFEINLTEDGILMKDTVHV